MNSDDEKEVEKIKFKMEASEKQYRAKLQKVEAGLSDVEFEMGSNQTDTGRKIQARRRSKVQDGSKSPLAQSITNNSLDTQSYGSIAMAEQTSVDLSDQDEEG